MFKRHLIVLLALLLGSSVFAQAYRWVDKDGVVHYSDRPEPGAEEIQLPVSRPSTGPTTARRTVPSTGRGNAPDPAPFNYQSLSIAAPAAEDTLWNIEGVLSVSLDLQPALQSGHQIRLYFDGTPQMVSGTSFELQGVYRGAHNLQAEVIDQSGNLMIRSEPSRFYVQQNKIGK
jgi:hypothetical protein